MNLSKRPLQLLLFIIIIIIIIIAESFDRELAGLDRNSSFGPLY
jgi:hypothetical protein